MADIKKIANQTIDINQPANQNRGINHLITVITVYIMPVTRMFCVTSGQFQKLAFNFN